MKRLVILFTIISFAYCFVIREVADSYDGPKPEPGMFYFVDDNGILREAYLDDISPWPRRVNVESDVKFYLYTRKHPTQYRLMIDNITNLIESTFNPKHPTKVLIHGFSSNTLGSSVQGPKKEYLRLDEFNVIGVDWAVLCNAPWYYAATVNTMDVGQYLGRLLNFLMTHGHLKLKDIHLMGHSLGAHVAAIAGNNIDAGIPPRITAFDAALPLYATARDKWKVSLDDADFIDSIHTNAGNLGFEKPVGHADFYPNGGKSQPGCGFDITLSVPTYVLKVFLYFEIGNIYDISIIHFTLYESFWQILVDMISLIFATTQLNMASCAHGRSYLYFSESINNPSAFESTECETLSEAKKGKCAGKSKSVFMGEYSTYRPESSGIYHLKTNKKEPYSLS